MAILRKIKEKFKKAMRKPLRKKLTVAETAEKKAQEKPQIKEQALGIQEMAVEQTKFSQPEVCRPAPRTMPADLPYGYGQDKIVLQVRDPWWLHAYWEVTPATYQRLQEGLREAFNSAKRVLRVYDVSKIIFNGRAEEIDTSNNSYLRQFFYKPNNEFSNLKKRYFGGVVPILDIILYNSS